MINHDSKNYEYDLEISDELSPDPFSEQPHTLPHSFRVRKNTKNVKTSSPAEQTPEKPEN